MNEMGETCKLCLKYIQGDTVAALDEDLLAKLDFIQMDLERSVEESNSICTECKEKIQNAFDFKFCLVQTENAELGASGSQAQNICDIPSTSRGESSTEKTICHLCKNSVAVISVISLEKLLKDDSVMEVFQGHIPELELKESENSMVCEPCQKALASFSMLVSSWSVANDFNEDDDDDMKEDMNNFGAVEVKKEDGDELSDSNTNSSCAVDASEGGKIVKKAKGNRGQITKVKTESEEESDYSESVSMNSQDVKKEESREEGEEADLQLKDEEVDIKDEDGMFSLVRFGNLEYCIVPSKRVEVLEGTNCIVRYTGAKYSAELIEESDEKIILDACRRTLESESVMENPEFVIGDNITSFHPQQTSVSTPLQSSSVKSSDISPQNKTFSVNSTNSFIEGSTDNSVEHITNGKKTENNFSLQTSDILLKNNRFSVNSTRSFTDECVEYTLHEKKNDSTNNSIFPSNIQELRVNLTNFRTQQTGVSTPPIQNKIFSLNSTNSFTSVDENRSENTIPNDDSTYHPESSTDNTSQESCLVTETIREKSPILTEHFPINIQELNVPSTSGVKSKKHFCPFCKTLQTKFARHLQLKHKNEEEVKKIINLPNKNIERMRIINSLRKRGDFLHNTIPELNSGVLIVARQRQQKSKNAAEDYVCCNTCKGFFAQCSIRVHTAKCDTNRTKGNRNILSASRRLTGYIHPVANKILRRTVFPVLNDDDVVKTIKYDELIILFGNKLCKRYTLGHQHDYIRSQLRMLGRFKLEIMNLDATILQFKDVFNPQNFDKTMQALRTIADWDENKGSFKIPFNAQFLSTLLKKCAKKLRSECIKTQDDERKKKVDDFLLLWEEEVPTVVGKKAQNDQIELRRKKKLVLPMKDDIKLLFDYLKKECFTYLEMLNAEFRSEIWKGLVECTLILIQIFNTRRAGEIERLTIMNYKNREVLNENIDRQLYQRLSIATKEFAKQFTRITIRGQLGRTVPVLLSPLAVECIEAILKFREQAGVSQGNEYIFSTTQKNKFSKPYLRACPLLRRFANECGAVMPSALRGTTLRKHIATYTSLLNVEEYRVDRLANFMENNKDIHKNIYRVPVQVTEITDVSRLLMAAIGEDDDGQGSDEQNSDSSDDETDSRCTIYNSDGQGPSFAQCSTSNTSPKVRSVKKIRRAKWSDQEKSAVLKHFGDIAKLNKLPSLKQCQRAIDESRVLDERTPQQIFAYINNQRRRLL